MSLASGVRLGAYEVLSLIGAGGMGEVYKARDTRLDRTVAIKVLPEQFAADPERRERFERECRAVAALNHPHICNLYDVGEARSLRSGRDAIRFLVMEYLEGQTLAERLLARAAAGFRGAAIRGRARRCAGPRASTRTRPPRPQAWQRHDDQRRARSCSTSVSRSCSPGPNLLALSTLSPGDVPLTAEGEVLGTFPYMAPEQLMGREADARSDIFAFGAIVHEMATGRRAFEGTTAATVIGAVLHVDPPPVSSIQPMAPPRSTASSRVVSPRIPTIAGRPRAI